MATVTASHFISRSSQYRSRGTCNSDPKSFAKSAAYLMNQTMSYHGLRSLNQVDLLSMRANVKATLQQARMKGFKHENGRPWAVIVCGIGMNVVFVSAEVAPWSKTGGLGDVLGGLPPAMAVFFFFLVNFAALKHNMVIKSHFVPR